MTRNLLISLALLAGGGVYAADAAGTVIATKGLQLNGQRFRNATLVTGPRC